MLLYLVTAYRWGSTNDHQYLVTITDNEAEALAAAEEACDDGGGKYGVQVVQRGGAGSKDIAYFPSMAKETAHEHNFNFDMLQTIGARIHEAVLSGGIVWDAPADEASHGPNVPRSVEVPAWVLDIVRDEKTQCRTSEMFQTQTRNDPVPTPAQWRAQKKDGLRLANALAVGDKAAQEVGAELAKASDRKEQILSGKF